MQEKLHQIASDPENNIKIVPDSDARPIQYQTQEQAIRHYARHGINGKRARARLIERQLAEEFGPEALKWRAIHDIIKPIPYIHDPNKIDEPYDYKNSHQTDDLLSYIHRLELVKQAVLSPDITTLTKRQSDHAERVLNEFNDPHGLKVDLTAQYVVIHELSEREVAGVPTEDIEDFFAYAPWLGETNTNLYRLAEQTGRVDYVQLHLIAPVVDGSAVMLTQMLTRDWQHLAGVHAALGLPYYISWRSREDKKLYYLDRLRPDLNEKIESAKIEQWKLLANWRAALSHKWSDKPMIEIPVSSDIKVEEQSND